jgi:uncharacterized protein YjbI with pentapeptide repeats
VVTNGGRTQIFPRFTVQASFDLTNWWDTTIVIPQQVGGQNRIISTNLQLIPFLPAIFARVRSDLDLSFADLRGVDLRGVDLSHQDLSYSDLSGALLSDANLAYSNLSYARLNNAVAERTIFNFANGTLLTASNANFSLAQFDETQMGGVVIPNAIFTGAFLRKGDWTNCVASRANFAEADIRDCKFHDGQLDHGNFYKTSFRSCGIKFVTFAYSQMDRVDFENANADETDFYSAVMTNCDILDSDFIDCDFRWVDFSDSEWEATDFSHSDFRNADLSGVSAWFCDFYGCDFW